MQTKHKAPATPRAAESTYLATRPAVTVNTRKLVSERNAANIKPPRPTKERRSALKKAAADQAATLELAHLLR